MRFVHLLLLLLLTIANLINAQDAEYDIYNYTIDDGLPSNECHDAVMDAEGYLWIATDRGLSRYDGYGFKNYGHKEGLSDLSCLDLFLDHKGRIWITTFGRKAFIYLPLEDRIIEYKYNHLISEANTSNQLLRDIYIDSLSNLYVVLYEAGLAKIDSSGRFTNLAEHLDKRIFIINVNDKPFLGSKGDHDVGSRINLNGKKTVIATKDNRTYYGDPKVFKLSADYTYLGANGYNYLIKYDTIVKKHLAESFQDLAILQDGKIVAGHVFNKGLKMYQNDDAIFTDEYSMLLSDISVSSILESNGDLFVTTTDQGLFYLKNKSISTIDHEELSLNRITSISTNDDGDIYAVIDRTEVVKYNRSTSRTSKIKTPLNEVYSLHFDENRKELCAGGLPQSIYIKEGVIGPIIYYNSKHQYLDQVTGKSIIPVDSNSTLIIRYNGFAEYKSIGELPVFDSNIHENYFRCNAVIKIGQNTYLIGGSDGLIYMDSSDIVSLDSIHPLFGLRINDMIEFDNNIYIGTQGSGLLVWDQKDSIEVIDMSKGLISNNVEKLHFTNQNKLAVGTYSGLSIMTISQSEILKIENYTNQNGLPANDIYDIDHFGDTLLVATGKGIALITSKEKADLHPAPIIEDVTKNGINIDPDIDAAAFDYDQNNIIISYKCLDLTMRGNIEYQYALNDSLWRETWSTSMNFAELRPGTYTFKVRSANKDGSWGELASYQFRISQPWWATSWFYLIAALLTGGTLYALYLRRIKRVEKESKIQNEMAQLERSALQAQMNPHFIFNCLNSIQSFIMSNEKESAMEYLSKFAQLIRQNLEISTESKLYLSEEIDMLKNYIELERLRFNDAFDYEIEVSNNINQDQVLIPPLLIQPYVENAILHGMKEKIGDGLIRIIFKKEEDVLMVSIIDNGDGIKKDQKDKHKSIGMSITQKRLNFINNHELGEYNIRSSSSDVGTEISIDIALS